MISIAVSSVQSFTFVPENLSYIFFPKHLEPNAVWCGFFPLPLQSADLLFHSSLSFFSFPSFHRPAVWRVIFTSLWFTSRPEHCDLNSNFVNRRYSNSAITAIQLSLVTTFPSTGKSHISVFFQLSVSSLTDIVPVSE